MEMSCEQKLLRLKQLSFEHVLTIRCIGIEDQFSLRIIASSSIAVQAPLRNNE